ncbi:MAG: hypothetical protein PSU94_06830 [Lacunisphaera sp.]|nr:hypothetical protein [Lacunisphaera sp.]
MAAKSQSPATVGQPIVDARFRRSCGTVARWSREQLLAVALARKCGHYVPLWPEITPCDDRALAHEILGCALLRGPADAATFQAIRCAAMVLSDRGNAPERIAYAAKAFGVTSRVVHISRLGRAHTRAGFWKQLLAMLPGAPMDEEDFLPGLSRLTVETGMMEPWRGPRRTWLRTNCAR